MLLKTQFPWLESTALGNPSTSPDRAHPVFLTLPRRAGVDRHTAVEVAARSELTPPAEAGRAACMRGGDGAAWARGGGHAATASMCRLSGRPGVLDALGKSPGAPSTPLVKPPLVQAMPPHPVLSYRRRVVSVLTTFHLTEQAPSGYFLALPSGLTTTVLTSQIIWKHGNNFS